MILVIENLTLFICSTQWLQLNRLVIWNQYNNTVKCDALRWNDSYLISYVLSLFMTHTHGTTQTNQTYSFASS